MVDLLSIHAGCDVIDLYYKQKAQFRFQSKSDNDFLKFLLDSAVRVITIVQQLTPVIKAVSEDVDDLSAYLSVDLHSKKKAEKTVTETSRQPVSSAEDLNNTPTPETSFVDPSDNAPGPSTQFTDSLPSQLFTQACKRKGTSSSEFSPSKKRGELEDEEVDVQHSVESIFLPSTNYSAKEEPVMIKQEPDQVADPELALWYTNLLNTLSNQSPDNPIVLSKETLAALTEGKEEGLSLSEVQGLVSSVRPLSEGLVRPPKVMNPLDTFCLTPGRLSLLSGSTRYNVSVGEVQRRLAYPESLNVSLLGAVLRRAKSKNGNHYLRQQVDLHGIKIPTGRRKCSSVTLFTSLLEGEAAQLSTDFNMLCEKFFPCRDLAKSAVLNDVQKYQSSELVQRVVNAKQMMQDLQEVTEISVVKNYEFINKTGPMGPAGMAPVPQLMVFELLTHGFGTTAITATLNIIQTYLDEMLKQLTQQL